VYYNGCMDFFRRANQPARVLGILPGTFNPPTSAHLALARAALVEADEVLFVLPRLFPHKTYEDASFADRIRMLLRATEEEPRFSVATTEGGLFIEIARECRQAYGENARLLFLCGADAAERTVNWDYGASDALENMLDVFELRVAPRQVRYCPPERFASRIRPLPVSGSLQDISASEVRRRVPGGGPWQHMVPSSIVPLVAEIYAHRDSPASGSRSKPHRRE
jgi:nicotinate-nucleotide adenylyltransferase